MPTDALTQYIEQERPRAKSLIVTVYGDALLPYGGACWLGELIDLVAPLGLNERMTRTAVFRLVQDGTLEAERIGRRSRYTLTRRGRRQFDSAQARIYASGPPARDGRWTFIILPDALAPGQRDSLDQRLGWQGFARLSPGLLGAARGDATQIAQDTLDDLSLTDDCAVFSAEATAANGLLSLAARAWPLEEIAADYSAFVKHFQPVLQDADQLVAESAFVARILLIHAYRRTLLRDPALPDDLLPEDWPGTKARALARDLYHHLYQATDQYLRANLEIEMPAQNSIIRFG